MLSTSTSSEFDRIDRNPDFWEPLVGERRSGSVETTMQPVLANPARIGAASQSAPVVAVHNFAAIYANDRNRLVRGLALTLRDDALASEAVDEAFTRAYHRWNTVGSFDEPQAWIYRTAHNWATSRFRRRSRDRKYSAQIARPEATVDVTPDPELAAALEGLPADQRQVLVLRYYLDWTIEACAEALNIAPGTVKSRTNRALKELNRTLGET